MLVVVQNAYWWGSIGGSFFFFLWCYKLFYMGLLNIKIDCVLFFSIRFIFVWAFRRLCLKVRNCGKKKEEHIKPKFDARTFRRWFHFVAFSILLWFISFLWISWKQKKNTRLQEFCLETLIEIKIKLFLMYSRTLQVSE